MNEGGRHLPVWSGMPFLSLACLISLASISSETLDGSGGSGNSCTEATAGVHGILDQQVSPFTALKTLLLRLLALFFFFFFWGVRMEHLFLPHFGCEISCIFCEEKFPPILIFVYLSVACLLSLGAFKTSIYWSFWANCDVPLRCRLHLSSARGSQSFLDLWVQLSWNLEHWKVFPHSLTCCPLPQGSKVHISWASRSGLVAHWSSAFSGNPVFPSCFVFGPFLCRQIHPSPPAFHLVLCSRISGCSTGDILFSIFNERVELTPWTYGMQP